MTRAEYEELPTAVFGARFVRQGAPIDVAPEDNPSSEPEPDLIVLKRDPRRHRRILGPGHCRPAALMVHRDPQDGRYVSVTAYGIEESVAPLAAPDSHLRVSDAFLE